MTSVTAVQCSTTCILRHLWVYYELTTWPAPRWLDRSVGSALQRYRRAGSWVRISSGMKFLQALISYFVKLCIMINHVFISFSAIQIHGLVFVTIYGYITNGLFMTSKENRRTDLKQNEHRNLTSNRRLDTFCN